MMISLVIGAAGFSQWSFMSRFRLFGKNPNPTDFVGLSDRLFLRHHHSRKSHLDCFVSGIWGYECSLLL